MFKWLAVYNSSFISAIWKYSTKKQTWTNTLPLVTWRCPHISERNERQNKKNPTDLLRKTKKEVEKSPHSLCVLPLTYNKPLTLHMYAILCTYSTNIWIFLFKLTGFYLSLWVFVVSVIEVYYIAFASILVGSGDFRVIAQKNTTQ